MAKPLKPSSETFLKISCAEAIASKHSLQDALDRVNRVRANLLPGALNIDLDHAARKICIGITLLRDSNKADYGQRSEVGGQGLEIRDQKPEVTCLRCGHVFRSAAKTSVRCTSCRHHFRIPQSSIVNWKS